MSNWAQEEYRRAQRRLSDAVAGRHQATVAEANARNLQREYQNRINQISSGRTNLERRVEELNSIVASLNNEVNSRIGDVNSAAMIANETFVSAIFLSGGRGQTQIKGANIETAHRRRSVTEDSNSSLALQAYNTEIQNVRQAIADLGSQIRSATAEIESLTRAIAGSSASQFNYQREINNAVANMAFYRRHF